MKRVTQTIIKAESFYIIASKNGSVIQAVETAKDGGDIRLGKYDHKPEQEWAFVRVGDGVYRIRNRASGKMIDLMMTGTTNGTWLHLWEDVSGTSQMWTVRPTPEGKVRLVSNWAAGKCIDTVGLGADEGAILQIWQETPGDDQLWTISEVKDRVKRAARTKKAQTPAEAKPVAEAAPAVETAAAVSSEPAEVELETAAAPEAPAPKPTAKRTRKASVKKAVSVEEKTETPAVAAEPAAPEEKPKRRCARRKKQEDK